MMMKGQFVNVAHVMALVRSRHPGSSGHDSLMMVGSHPPPELGTIRRKDSYVLGDLLEFYGPSFVRNAYLALLRRQPDSEGLKVHLDGLLSGRRSRIDILGDLRWSAEGLSNGVHVDGLLAPTIVERWKRKKYIGRLVALADRITGFTDRPSRLLAAGHHLAADIERVASRVEESRRELGELAEAASAIRERDNIQESKLAGFEAEIHELRAEMQYMARSALIRGEQMERAHAESVTMERKAFKAEVERLEGLIDAAEKKSATLIDEHEVRMSAFQKTIASVDGVAQKLQDDLARTAEEVSVHGGWIGSAINAKSDKRALRASRDSMYVSFENAFRGDPGTIKERMRPYLDKLNENVNVNRSLPLLDIGSGGGEWLELLRDAGISAKGVDSNHIFVESCQSRGLDVTHRDAVAFISDHPDGSFSAITAMHVVEHVGFNKLITLLDQCERVLAPGGLLILETPNPENLLVASKYFYLDPTHRNPIPPETLQWLVGARGFSKVEIERLTHAREMDVPELLPSSNDVAGPVNRVLEMLRAAPDYAVIAVKG